MNKGLQYGTMESTTKYDEECQLFMISPEKFDRYYLDFRLETEQREQRRFISSFEVRKNVHLHEPPPLASPAPLASGEGGGGAGSKWTISCLAFPFSLRLCNQSLNKRMKFISPSFRINNHPAFSY